MLIIIVKKILIAFVIIIIAAMIIRIIVIIVIIIVIIQTFKAIKAAIIIPSIMWSYQTVQRNQFHSHYCWELTAGIITVVKETDYFLQTGSLHFLPQILPCSLAKTSPTVVAVVTAAKWARYSATRNYLLHSRYGVFQQTLWVFITQGYLLIQAYLNIAWKAIQIDLDTTA